MHDLLEGRVVAHDEHALVGVVRQQQLERVVGVEAVGQDGRLLRLDVERPAGQARRVARPDLRARVAGGELDAEARKCGPGGDCLALAPGRQLPIGVGLRLMWNSFSMTKEPELLSRHCAVRLPTGSSHRQYDAA